MFGADSPAAWASLLAFDDVLKRSSADELKRLLDPEPQPASPKAKPNSVAMLPATRMLFPFFLAASLLARSDNRIIVAVNRRRL
jgi:hypothetical protein